MTMWNYVNAMRAGHRTRHLPSWVATPFVALLCLWTMWGTLTPSASATAPSRSYCQAGIAGCAQTSDLANASNSESEEAEEEEFEEGTEEAATAEVESEEAEASTENSSTPGSTGEGSVVLSHLELTTNATAALAHHLPSVSAIGFSFRLSAPAKVQVTILRQTGSGHTHWTALPDSLTLTLARGHITRSLKGHSRLPPGRYRLTAKPSDGRSRAIYLSVRR
jgi:hypothetical protein